MHHPRGREPYPHYDHHDARGQVLDIDTRTYNALLRGLGCLAERGFALLTRRWRIPQHITASPGRIGDIAKAALVLTHFGHGYVR